MYIHICSTCLVTPRVNVCCTSGIALSKDSDSAKIALSINSLGICRKTTEIGINTYMNEYIYIKI